MMLAGSPGSAQISAVMIAGTANGSSRAATTRTPGLSHHCFTRPTSQTYSEGARRRRFAAGYLAYFQESISVK